VVVDPRDEDLVADHAISLGEKTYTREMGDIYTEAEKKEFRVALGNSEEMSSGLWEETCSKPSGFVD
jgi:hypothetical protein